jgi:predicted metal-binding protein
MVICLRLPIECFHHLPPEARYPASFNKARSLLLHELSRYRSKGYAVAGSGACPVCSECAAMTGGERCKNPSQQIYSLESLGVNVAALVNRCFDIHLEWSSSQQTADFVCAVGAAFLNEQGHS